MATTKELKKELRTLLDAEDGKVRGGLLAWCILTGFMIAQGIYFGGNELVNWIHAGFILMLLIMAIMGRGSRRFIFIISGILAIGLFVNTINTTGASLKSSCMWSDWGRASWCASIPDYAWESEAHIMRISGAIMASYYGITAVYFCFSKRVKKHFTYAKRKAELWRELEERDGLDQEKSQTDDKPEKEPDDGDEKDDGLGTELKALKEENRKLADKIEKLEQKTKKKGKE